MVACCLAVLAWRGLGHAQEPAEKDLRAAATKGLGFVAKAGAQWIEDKNCNGCHHLPEMLWSHREAKRRGIAIDDKQYAEWLAWAQPKVQSIAAGREQVAFMTLALPDTPPPEAQKLILGGQLKDGSWKSAGQFASMQRRDTAEAQLHSMRLFLLALASSEGGRKAADEARAKAAAFMTAAAGPKPLASSETLAFHALYAHRFDLKDERDAALTQLLKHQREDGGWSWAIDDPQSDALATGEALYVLHELQDKRAHEAIHRAQQWLIRAQAADGSWPVDLAWYSKHDRSGETKEKQRSRKAATAIYRDWAAAWGTLGLLHGLPLTDPDAAAVPAPDVAR